MTQVEALEAELSGARKSAAGQATELAALSKRLSDGLARSAKLDDKVGVPAFTIPMPACAHHGAKGCAGRRMCLLKVVKGKVCGVADVYLMCEGDECTSPALALHTP